MSDVVRQSLLRARSESARLDSTRLGATTDTKTHLHDLGIPTPNPRSTFHRLPQRAPHHLHPLIGHHPSRPLLHLLRIVKAGVEIHQVTFRVREAFGAGGEVGQLLEDEIARFAW